MIYLSQIHILDIGILSDTGRLMTLRRWTTLLLIIGMYHRIYGTRKYQQVDGVLLKFEPRKNSAEWRN